MAAGVSPDVGGDIFVDQGSVYSPQGQDALANALAGIDPNAPADDWATDGGVAVDTGAERWDEQGRPIEQDNRFTALDEVREEWEREKTAQWAEQAIAESEAGEHEQEFQAALEHYSELPAEEQAEVCTESVARGYGQAAELVNAEQAQVLNEELFAGQVDALPTATLMAFWANNALETLSAAGLNEITPQQAQELTDPHMAGLFAAGWKEATGLDVTDPMDFAATMFRHAPLLLSGVNSDLIPVEMKQSFVADLCRVHGVAVNLEPAQAAQLFDNWHRWGARLGAGLNAHRQQAQPAKQGRAKPSRLKWGKSNADLFDDEAVMVWESQHSGL